MKKSNCGASVPSSKKPPKMAKGGMPVKKTKPAYGYGGMVKKK